MEHKERVQLRSSACGDLVFSTSFIQKVLSFPHWIVLLHLSSVIWLFISELYSFLLNYVILPEPHYLHYFGFVVSFEPVSMSLPIWIFFKIVLGSLDITYEFLECVFLFLQSPLLGFWQALHWLCKWLWRVLTS
jgi:hypothetical protein